MTIKQISLGQLKTNCYILYKGTEGIIIDPADASDFISDEICRLNIKPQAIVATHGHFDHILAAGELQKIFNIPFYINKKDTFLLNEMNKSNQYWTKTKLEYPIPLKINELNENDEIFDLKVITTPGHTPGSICLYLKNKKTLFSGDTLFKEAIGRYDFSYSSKGDIKNSLNKLFQLPEDTLVLPGHGENTILKYEKKY